MYDLIVVGGGPAGLTATIYAIRKRLNVLLITKDLGGKTNYRLALPWIEDYQVIRGLEVVNKFKSELEYLKFARHMEPVEKITQTNGGFTVQTKGGGELSAKSVIVATGTLQKWLNVPGEKKFMMRGLCYSALSYAPLFIDKRTVVVGEGELALRSAAELATVAEHVTLVGPCGNVLDSPLCRKLHIVDNVDVLEGYQAVEFLGEDYCERVVVKAPEGATSTLEADGTFVEMGLVPHSHMIADLVETDEQGSIKIDSRAATSVPGVFAAGDVTDIGGEQVLIAVGEGAKAALSAYEYLLPTL